MLVVGTAPTGLAGQAAPSFLVSRNFGSRTRLLDTSARSRRRPSQLGRTGRWGLVAFRDFDLPEDVVALGVREDPVGERGAELLPCPSVLSVTMSVVSLRPCPFLVTLATLRQGSESTRSFRRAGE